MVPNVIGPTAPNDTHKNFLPLPLHTYIEYVYALNAHGVSMPLVSRFFQAAHDLTSLTHDRSVRLITSAGLLIHPYVKSYRASEASDSPKCVDTLQTSKYFLSRCWHSA